MAMWVLIKMDLPTNMARDEPLNEEGSPPTSRSLKVKLEMEDKMVQKKEKKSILQPQGSLSLKQMTYTLCYYAPLACILLVIASSLIPC